MRPFRVRSNLTPDEALTALRACTEVRPLQGCEKECMFRGELFWREGRITIRSASRRGCRGSFVGEYHGTVKVTEGGRVIEVAVFRKKWDYVLLAAFLLLPWVNAILEPCGLQTTLVVLGLAVAPGLGHFWFSFLDDREETRIELHRVFHAEEL